jgi:GNAT superfamily N-acetyltransferase
MRLKARCKEKSLMLRQMTEHDLDSVMEIQKEAHAQPHCESKAVFNDKLSRFPEGCLVAVAENSNRVIGYLFSHPWCADRPPELNKPLDPSITDFDCFYIHDLAAALNFQKHVVARELMAKVGTIAAAQGFDTMILIAVDGSRPFWEKMGFEAIFNLSGPIRKKLTTYPCRGCFLFFGAGYNAPRSSSPKKERNPL